MADNNTSPPRSPVLSVSQIRDQFSKHSTIPDLTSLMRDRFGDFYQSEGGSKSSTPQEGKHRANQHIIKQSHSTVELEDVSALLPSDHAVYKSRLICNTNNSRIVGASLSKTDICLEEFNPTTGSPCNAFILPIKTKQSPVVEQMVTPAYDSDDETIIRDTAAKTNVTTNNKRRHDVDSSHTTDDHDDERILLITSEPTIDSNKLACSSASTSLRKPPLVLATIFSDFRRASPPFSTSSDSSSIMSDMTDMSPITFFHPVPWRDLSTPRQDEDEDQACRDQDQDQDQGQHQHQHQHQQTIKDREDTEAVDHNTYHQETSRMFIIDNNSDNSDDVTLLTSAESKALYSSINQSTILEMPRSNQCEVFTSFADNFAKEREETLHVDKLADTSRVPTESNSMTSSENADLLTNPRLIPLKVNSDTMSDDDNEEFSEGLSVCSTTTTPPNSTRGTATRSPFNNLQPPSLRVIYSPEGRLQFNHNHNHNHHNTDQQKTTKQKKVYKLKKHKRNSVDEIFTGARQGYMYRQGSHGMGYYEDKVSDIKEGSIYHHQPYSNRRRRRHDGDERTKWGCKCM